MGPFLTLEAQRSTLAWIEAAAVALAVAGCVAVSAVEAQPAGWQTITGPPVLSFPRDHGSHPAYQTEWWYVTGHLEDERGAVAGYQLTFFRRGLDPSPPAPGESSLRARQVLAAHLAVADLGGGAMRFAERLRRTAGGLAGAAEETLDVWLEDWELRLGNDGVLRLAAADPDAGVALDLELRPVKPPVLHGEAGMSRKGAAPGYPSAYVSWTRLATRGRLAIGRRSLEVRGESWFDHEWGTSQLEAGVVGWDWFGLHLDDGRELMLYRLRRADGSASPFSSGTLVERDGRSHRLGAADIAIEPAGAWRSAATGASYPASFRVRVLSAGLDLQIRPELPDSELRTRSTGVVYWEGPVAVSGTLAGRGYAELTGYAGSLGGRF